MEKKIEKLVKKFKWVILGVCIILFYTIVVTVIFNGNIDNTIAIDTKVYDFISKYLIKDVVTPIAKFVTNFANPIVLGVISLIILVVVKNKKFGISVGLNLIISVLINVIVKNFLQRPRPVGNRLIDEWGYSLPSGHSMVSLCFYGLLMYLIYRTIKNKYLKYGLIIFLSLLILCIGISRIYLGVHYTTDVLAGFLVAIPYLIIFIMCVKKLIFKDDLKEELNIESKKSKNKEEVKEK